MYRFVPSEIFYKFFGNFQMFYIRSYLGVYFSKTVPINTIKLNQMDFVLEMIMYIRA